MATPSYIGDNSWRTVATEESVNSEGLDTLTITRRGSYLASDEEWDSYERTDSATPFGKASMYLTSKTRRKAGQHDEITLQYEGFLGDAFVNPISVTDSIDQQATTLVTTTGENVQVKFMAQSTTARWLSYSLTAPRSPQYPATVPSDIDSSNLFDPYPANYTGTLQYVVRGRLMAFQREQLATGVWAVVETWAVRVEPA